MIVGVRPEYKNRSVYVYESTAAATVWRTVAFFASLGDIVGTENTVQKSKLLFATLLVPGPVNNFPFQLNGFWSSQCQNCGYSQGECVR